MVAGQSNEDKGLEVQNSKDDDPDGIKLLGCSDPLERAAKFLHPLTQLDIQNVNVWIAVYDVAIRRSGWHLCRFMIEY